ncbi:opioid growth factor receptor (ogfr) region protein [Diplonema papillatum]|nr:opioid growth factor receptor (ogfr) region protein [Diplonema papillatum]
MYHTRQQAAADTKAYRDGYPGKPDDPSQSQNVEFYKGQRRCRPDGLSIDEVLAWKGQYELLEYRPCYIQWLFPTREKGLNAHAQELQPHEAAEFAGSGELRAKVLQAYAMMLDFWGMRVDLETGAVGRAGHWRDRYQHLQQHRGNCLRITRVLKCLGEVGLERFKLPLLKHLLEELVVHGNLASVAKSLQKFWVGTLREPEHAAALQAHSQLLERRKKKRKRTAEPDATKPEEEALELDLFCCGCGRRTPVSKPAVLFTRAALAKHQRLCPQYKELHPPPLPLVSIPSDLQVEKPKAKPKS